MMHELSDGNTICPLCGGKTLTLYHSASHAVPWRLYAPSPTPREVLQFFRCRECDLVVKDREVRPTIEQERAHYAKHNNDVHESGYRGHLSRLLDAVLSSVSSGAEGLDYGCGPALSIEVIARERGYLCHSYDPLFFHSTSLLSDRSYDFITCSEVAEHFATPHEEFHRLRAMLKVGGVLGVMTQVVPDAFADWWYHRDPTHRVFYAPTTFAWIAERYGFDLLEKEGPVFVLRKIGPG